MTARRFAELTCDDPTCQQRFTGAGEVGEVRDIAITFGWTYVHPGRDRCPAHPRPKETS